MKQIEAIALQILDRCEVTDPQQRDRLFECIVQAFQCDRCKLNEMVQMQMAEFRREVEQTLIPNPHEQ